MGSGKEKKLACRDVETRHNRLFYAVVLVTIVVVVAVLDMTPTGHFPCCLLQAQTLNLTNHTFSGKLAPIRWRPSM